MPLPVSVGATALCKHYLITKMKFTSKVIGKVNSINGGPSRNIKTVISLITCDKCKAKYKVSAMNL